MIELNLQTSNKQEEIIKDCLQNNVSEVLADKINDGVKITKDNKTLINKKTLSGFMKYACNEAREQAEKGSNCACIEDKVVFGWAIHYFEEDTIEENLYNEDGTEYKVEIKTTAPKVEVKPQPKKPEKQQVTLFDFMNFKKPKEENLSYKAQLSTYSQQDILENEEENEFNNDEEEPIEEKQETNNTKIDLEAGEILDKEITIQNQTFDKFQLKTISVLLDGKVVLK